MGQTAADQLRQVIVPDLVRLVGDIKVQRVSPSGVTAYLHRQQLIFDEQLLLSMFDEADFKHEGSLGVGPLTGAIQGRFPKRRHGQADWLALVSVILQRPVQELQNLLAPAPSKSVRFATSNSMDVTSSTQGGAVAHGLQQAKRNPAFIKKAPQGEWQTLIRATSNLQPVRTGSLPCGALAASDKMHSLKPSATAQPANFTAGATAGRLLAHPATAASGSCSYPMDDATAVAVAAPALPNDRLGEDLSATAMSIDTPSYARSLGMGQLGSAAGFAASLFQGSQDLAQSMSIDGVQADLVSGQAAASSGADWGFNSSSMGHHGAPLLMMTTSGLKSLGESAEEEQINQDIRQGCASFASQQRFQSFVGGMEALSQLATDAASCRTSTRCSVVRRKPH